MWFHTCPRVEVSNIFSRSTLNEKLVLEQLQNTRPLLSTNYLLPRCRGRWINNFEWVKRLLPWCRGRWIINFDWVNRLLPRWIINFEGVKRLLPRCRGHWIIHFGWVKRLLPKCRSWWIMSSEWFWAIWSVAYITLYSVFTLTKTEKFGVLFFAFTRVVLYMYWLLCWCLCKIR